MAALAQALAIGVEQFGGEGAAADAGGVGLDDAQHIADRAGAKTGARRRLSRHGVGRGDKGIGAVIDIKQRALRAFEQHPLARPPHLVQQAPGRAGKGQNLGGDVGQGFEEFRRIDLGQVKPPAKGLVVGQQAFDLAFKSLGIGKVRDADRPAADLVLIGRANAATGGADLACARLGLARGVQIAVNGQDQGGVVGQNQKVRRDLHALRANAGYLVQQGPRIDHHAIADHRQLALDHAGGEKRELVDLFADHEGVSGIVAALKAHHHIGPVRQPVDQLSLAFIAPLGADDCNIGHG